MPVGGVSGRDQCPGEWPGGGTGRCDKVPGTHICRLDLQVIRHVLQFAVAMERPATHPVLVIMADAEDASAVVPVCTVLQGKRPTDTEAKSGICQEPCLFGQDGHGHMGPRVVWRVHPAQLPADAVTEVCGDGGKYLGVFEAVSPASAVHDLPLDVDRFDAWMAAKQYIDVGEGESFQMRADQPFQELQSRLLPLDADRGEIGIDIKGIQVPGRARQLWISRGGHADDDTGNRRRPTRGRAPLIEPSGLADGLRNRGIAIVEIHRLADCRVGRQHLCQDLGDVFP